MPTWTSWLRYKELQHDVQCNTISPLCYFLVKEPARKLPVVMAWRQCSTMRWPVSRCLLYSSSLETNAVVAYLCYADCWWRSMDTLSISVSIFTDVSVPTRILSSVALLMRFSALETQLGVIQSTTSLFRHGISLPKIYDQECVVCFGCTHGIACRVAPVCGFQYTLKERLCAKK